MVEAIMRYIAQDYGYDKDFWGIAGQLHDVDYEMYPEEHCVKCIELLKEIDASDELIHAVCSHGNVMDMEVSSLKKKFKDKTFARGCSRDIIKKGCEMLGWDLNELFEKCIKAIEINEEQIENNLKN